MDDKRRFRIIVALVMSACGCAAAFAEAVFVLGQPAPLTGVQAVTGKSTHEGMRLYADWINRSGGVHGRRIQLVVRDDAHQPAQTIQVVRELIEQDNAILLVGGTGTANIEALVKEKTLAQSRIALLGPTSGATSLFGVPELFMLRPSYDDEASRIADLMAGFGHARVGIVFQNDSFGRGVHDSAVKHLQRHGVKVAVAGSYERNTVDVDAAVDAMLKSDLQGIVLGAVSLPAATIVKRYRERGGKATLFGLSILDPAVVVKVAGPELARGLVLTSVMPNPKRERHRVVREINEIRAQLKRADAEMSYRYVEGYLVMKVAVEALRRAGPNADRASVQRALETIRSLDLGGFVVSFDDRKRAASVWVDSVIIGIDGALVQ